MGSSRSDHCSPNNSPLRSPAAAAIASDVRYARLGRCQKPPNLFQRKNVFGFDRPVRLRISIVPGQVNLPRSNEGALSALNRMTAQTPRRIASLKTPARSCKKASIVTAA